MEIGMIEVNSSCGNKWKYMEKHSHPEPKNINKKKDIIYYVII